MDHKFFFSLYLPALESALANDTNNVGFHVFGPSYYIPDDYAYDCDYFTDNTPEHDVLFNAVGYYFDAKSHYAESIMGINIQIYKNYVLNLINFYKHKYEIE